MSKIGFIKEYDMTTEPIVLKYNANEVGDTSVSDTYLEVTGLGEDQSIGAIGYVLEDSNGIAMSFADISNIGVVEVIEQDGLYMVLSGALEKLVLTCTGSCHLTIKQVL